MKLIVGLGNPGREYELSRHNVGFLAVDQIADKYGVSLDRLKGKALVGEFRHGFEKVILAKPQSYMNNSGQPVRALVDFYKLDPQDLIVICDDIDIPLGTIRIKAKGSSGSHNGMRSIVKHLGSEDFTRIRISIGQNPSHMDLASYVLARIDEGQMDLVEKEILAAAQAAMVCVEEGPEAAMNMYNGMDFNG